MEALFALGVVYTLFAGALTSFYRNKLCWSVLVILMALTAGVAVYDFYHECRWPAFVFWALPCFLSFTQLEKDRTDAQNIFSISFIALLISGNVIGFHYDIVWMIVVTTILEIFGAVCIYCALFTKGAPSEYFSEMYTDNIPAEKKTKKW